MKFNFVLVFILAFVLCACENVLLLKSPKPIPEKIVYAGEPQATTYKNNLTILANKGFVVGYDQKRLNPAWVAYKVFQIAPDSVSPKRPSHFEEDERLTVQVSHEDYTHSGYDRGHMAPNYAIATRYGKKAQLQTFLTSNITPQKHTLNDGIWKKNRQ